MLKTSPTLHHPLPVLSPHLTLLLHLPYRREQRVSPPLFPLPLTLLFPPSYRRKQRVSPPLFSLRSARALPLIPSRRTAPFPSLGEPGLQTRPPHRRPRPSDHHISRCHHHPRLLLSPPLLDVGGGTRGLRILSCLPPTKSPTGGERLRISPLSNRRQPL